MLAAPPVGIAFVLGISVVAHALPPRYPVWVRRVVSEHGRSAHKITVSKPRVPVPLICWSTALLLRRLSRLIHVEYDDAWDAGRISFVVPLLADGLLGSPEAVFYPDAREHGPEPFCVPHLTLAEEQPTSSDPNERHPIRASAQCLLIEGAYQTTVDLGLLQFRNRSVAFVMTRSARKRTRETLAEIRRLQSANYRPERNQS